MSGRVVKDWWEWIELERARIRQGFALVLYQLAGAAQDPPQRHPKTQPVFYTPDGYLCLPPDWQKCKDLDMVTLVVLPLGQGGPPYRPVVLPIALVGPHYGQEVFERTVCGVLPIRMPRPPFAGAVHIEFRVRGRRLWSNRQVVECGWHWPQEAE